VLAVIQQFRTPCVFIVPVDVFSPNSDWSGFYEYLGKRQVSTITVTGFNASSGRVNVTLLETSGVSIKLSGKGRYYYYVLPLSSKFTTNAVKCEGDVMPYFCGETTVNPYDIRRGLLLDARSVLSSDR